MLLVTATSRISGRIRDITDGRAYQEAYAIRYKEIMSHKNNRALVTLILNTDSLSLNGSGNRSAWPVFGVIAELPSSRRYLPDKIINLALWYGEGKSDIS